ncbi:ABC-type transporter, integral membrane subunit [Rhizobium sp. PDO1-076]|nr:ABC-type transporter, integral membrane subunit [Rhizobium sp. PDO1-076]
MTPSVPVSQKFGYRFSWVGMIGLTVILFWGTMALIAPHIIPHPVGEIVDEDYFGVMSSRFWLGSDYLGRDMLSRVLMGARYTVGISLAAVSIACFSGVVLGMTAAVVGGWFDAALSRFLDALNSIPGKLSGLVVVAAVGSSITVLIITLAVIYTPGAYRFARALAVNINTMDYITVARTRGEGIFTSSARRSCRTSSGLCLRISAFASSSSCCCCPACRSSASACNRHSPIGARLCMKMSAACLSEHLPSSFPRWRSRA